MRGPHPKDFCDLYTEGGSWVTSGVGLAIIAHFIIVGLIFIDILFILFSTNKRLLSSKTKKWISITLISSIVIWFELISLGSIFK